MSEPTAPQPATERGSWTLIRRMLQLSWQFRGLCLLVLGLQLLLVGLTLVSLGGTGLGIDVLRAAVEPGSPPAQWPLGWKPPANWSPLAQVTLIAGLVLVTAVVTAGIKYAGALASTALSQRILVHLRSTVYDRLQRLSFRFFDRHDSGSMINRVAGDVQAVRGFVDGVLLKIVIVLLSLAAYLVYMVALHPGLALACLATSPVLWWGAVQFSRRTRPAYLESSQLHDEMIRTLTENVQGQQVVKGFGREAEEIARFARANERLRVQKFGIFWLLSVYQPAMGLLTQLNMVVLLAYGGYLVLHDQLPLGAGLFVFANLLQEFAGQVGQITNIANSIQTSLTGAERVYEIWDAPAEVSNLPDPLTLDRVAGQIEFRDVSFGYLPDRPVLEQLSFRVAAGECVGIAGETGAGKTTLLGLITRFYDVTSGAVLIDGHDVRSVELASLRRNIGLVFQETFLFSNTVAANIAFGDPTADPARIETAAEIAAASDFIEELPERYDSLIGEHGATLSGGQRQRLAIARAVLLDPPILLFDDATAAVDSETEHAISESLAQSQAGRTTIVVSSRIRTLERCTRILMLSGGRLVEQGTHAELMARPGPYRRLAELQSLNVADDANRLVSAETPR